MKKSFWMFFKFVMFSISAVIIQIGSFTLLNEILSLPYWLSYLAALVLSVLWYFTFNRKFTFKWAANVPAAMLKVAAVLRGVHSADSSARVLARGR